MFLMAEVYDINNDRICRVMVYQPDLLHKVGISTNTDAECASFVEPADS